MSWQISNTMITNRLLLGTARYPSLEVMQQAIKTSESEIITVALKRQLALPDSGQAFWEAIKNLGCHILPNTAGCHSAQEAITTAEMARELFNTHWVKLEVIGDDYTLQPDPFETVVAAKELIMRGFEVFPYCTEDLILCQRLVEVGCQILMPWGSPIGSGKGLLNPYALELLRYRFPKTTLIIDAGIGKPSHAIQAMELGYDAVLLNTAVSTAADPIVMAGAFRDAIKAGRAAYQAGLIAERTGAQASTSLIDTPFWHGQKVD